ncbi:nicotinate (nicotinamide) nucleotide adenylyltransferase [Haloferula sp.]|uniref:nicotinate (nicotinamide) nucleotide adenylyltransferase n=1 Tax=Haloferula sp. TaxID=2497595 RepID=UPI00329D663D
MNHPKNIALFGGSFDPIHYGHLMIAEEAVKSLNLDEVRFLPCRISPHKMDQAPAQAEHRLEMIRLAIQDLPWAVADNFELTSPEPSYSYLTVAETRSQQPDAKLFWLMGCDQWNALPRWREADKLAEELEFVVFFRGEAPKPRPGWRLHKLNGRHPASSTRIREDLRAGRPLPDWLPAPVASYIRRNRLYTA